MSYQYNTDDRDDYFFEPRDGWEPEPPPAFCMARVGCYAPPHPLSDSFECSTHELENSIRRAAAEMDARGEVSADTTRWMEFWTREAGAK